MYEYSEVSYSAEHDYFIMSELEVPEPLESWELQDFNDLISSEVYV